MATSKELKSFETRLNKDEALRTTFLKNPVKVLKDEGFDLTPEMAQSVNAQFKDLQLPKLPKTARPKISISIQIRIRF